LEPARVGEHGTVPLHEFVQATQVTHQLVTGAQIKMIGVAQHQRGMDIFEVLRGQGLDRCLRPHRREDRCEQVAVRCSKNPRAGTVVFGSDLEFEHATNYTGGATTYVDLVTFCGGYRSLKQSPSILSR